MSDTIDNGQQKSELAAQLGSILFKLDISMGQTAKRLEIKQTAVAQILNRELDDFTVEQLQRFVQQFEG